MAVHNYTNWNESKVYAHGRGQERRDTEEDKLNRTETKLTEVQKDQTKEETKTETKAEYFLKIHENQTKTWPNKVKS